MKNKDLINKKINSDGILKFNIKILNKIEVMQINIIEKEENSFEEYMAMIGSAYKLNEILKTLPVNIKTEYENKFKIIWEKWYTKSNQLLEKEI